MYDSKRTVVALVAVVTVVGFAVAPTAAVAAEDGGLQIDQVTDDTGVQADHGPFPHDVCTDLLGMIHEEAPYDMIVWVDDLPEGVPRDVPEKDQLPEDLRPPGIPWSVVTPSAVGGIVVGATPNQCDIQDPNDPSFDPIRNSDDNIDPDAGGDVQPGDTGEVLFIVNGTLDQTSEGPSGTAEANLNLTENGTLDPDTQLNDGEKDYGVDPNLQYWSDGTTYFETDVYVFSRTVGVEQDCFGEECNFATRGLPNFAEYPAFPSHTDRERRSGDSDDSDDADGGDDGADDGGPGADDSSSSDGVDGADGTDGSDGDDGSDGESDTGDGSDGGSDSGDGGDGSTDGDGADGSDGSDGDGSDGSDGDGDDGSDGDANQQQSADDGSQDAQQAAAADGTGLGILVALVVFILGAAAIAPRD